MKLNLPPIVPYVRIGEHFDDIEEGISRGRTEERRQIAKALRDRVAHLEALATRGGVDAPDYALRAVECELLADQLDPEKKS